SGYIFRAFYATPPLSNEQGVPTNAVYGFTRMLLKLLRDVSPKYLAVAFDNKEPTFRHLMYPAYKSNRAECPADLVPQMPYFRRIAKLLGLTCLDKPGVEADDVIATLVRVYKKQGNPICVISGDKDLLQLVDEQVTVWDAMRDIQFDAARVEEKLGVPPTKVIDFLSLTGDTSDHIPGARGVGPKTASKLLQDLGSLEQILAEPAAIERLEDLRGKAGVRSKIESSLDEIRLSQKLVTLKDDVEPYVDWRELSALEIDGVDLEHATELFAELSFTNMIETLRDYGVHVAGAETLAANSNPAAQYEIVTEAGLADFSARLSQVSEFAFDTETTGLNIRHSTLLGISISWEEGKAFYLPLAPHDGSEFLPIVEVKRVLGPIFANPAIKKVGLNLKFDTKVLHSAGFEVQGLDFDILIASYLLRPDARQQGLKQLAREVLHETMATYKEVVGVQNSLAEVPLEQVAQYAAADADFSLRLKRPFLAELEAHENGVRLKSVFQQIEMPLVPVLAEMEEAGVMLDRDCLAGLREVLTIDLARLERNIYELAGGEFNLNSPKQLSEVLFERLGIPTRGIKRTKTSFSTDASVLSKLAEEHEIAVLLLEYRELFKLLSTYVESLDRLVDPETGRIHTTFNQTVAATGRLSSSDPNLQNIPIRGERGRMLRQAFIAPEGAMLLAADYSQIELRILAHLSQDTAFLEAFRSGEDIHQATGVEIFGAGRMASTEGKELRRIAKTINFGIIYGISPFRLSSQLGVSRREAGEYIDNYFKRYRQVREYLDEQERLVEESGVAVTLLGRRRVLSDVDATGRDAGYRQRSLMNFPIQGTAADIVKLAMIRTREALRLAGLKARMVLQVHDELVLEVPYDELEQAQSLVRMAMEDAVKLDVPLTVDMTVSPSWGGSKWSQNQLYATEG
ncbi:MAG: DNA polymerase I, partial [bacterium]|nr:DNA polymerase I [bacterium]